MKRRKKAPSLVGVPGPSREEKELTKAAAELLDRLGIPYLRVDVYRCYRCGARFNKRAKGAPDLIVPSSLSNAARNEVEFLYFLKAFFPVPAPPDHVPRP